jgi:dihydrofolate reductase
MIKLIAAVEASNGIGWKNKLPWDLPEDLKRFSKLTSGGTIIMGRLTYESLPGVLPNRQSIVVTKTHITPVEMIVPKRAASVLFVASIADALAYCDNNGWVIGGQSLYEQALPVAQSILLTRIHQSFPCDRFFPEIGPEFKQVWLEEHREGAIPFTYETWRREQ